MAALAFPGDDLQPDVEAAALVPGEPHMAHPARAEGADRPVTAQEEIMRKGRLGHPAFLRCGAPISSPAGSNGLIPVQVDPRDDDIEFDFFDEPATTESQPSSPRVRLPRRG